jgi:4-alpha-glucanotransferase
LHYAFVRALYASVANTVVIPIQDILGLDGSARMNEPGTVENNWRWRMSEAALTQEVANGLAELTETFGRKG